MILLKADWGRSGSKHGWVNAGKPIGASQLRAERELLAGNWNVPKCGFCDFYFYFSLFSFLSFLPRGIFWLFSNCLSFFLFELFYQTNSFLVRVNGLNEVNMASSPPYIASNRLD